MKEIFGSMDWVKGQTITKVGLTWTLGIGYTSTTVGDFLTKYTTRMIIIGCISIAWSTQYTLK